MPNTRVQALLAARDEEMNFPEPAGTTKKRFKLRGILQGCEIGAEDTLSEVRTKLQGVLKRVEAHEYTVDELLASFDAFPDAPRVSTWNLHGAYEDLHCIEEVDRHYNRQLASQIRSVIAWLDR